MFKNLLVFTFLIHAFIPAFSQDREYASYMIDTLCSPELNGRGYVNNGDIKAAELIEKEFRKAGLEPFLLTYYHRFRLKVNTFPGALKVQFESGDTLIPGRDFVVNPESGPGDIRNMKLYRIDTAQLLQRKGVKKLLKKCKDRLVPVLPATSKDNKELNEAIREFLASFQGPLLIQLSSKLVWSVGRGQRGYAMVEILNGKLPESAETISVQVDASFISNYGSRNVLAMVKGKVYPDSFIFISAHYDHLGRMGANTYIPGANDNASGVAMMLDMARHYANNPPDMSIVFVGFAAEEAGLVGSYHLVQYLKKDSILPRIKFLVNMDLMGSGQEGIMAVNGQVFTGQFALLQELNSDSLMPAIKSRGKAANSDHYFFTEEGVPAFFFYLMGPYQYYHEVDDSPENLQLSEYYDRAFLLIRRFVDALMVYPSTSGQIGE